MFLTKAWHGLFRLASRQGTGRQRDGHRPAPRLCLELLERRCLPSGYTITDIGPIGFGNDYNGSTLNAPNSGINNAPNVQVVGRSASTGHAFLWDSIHGMQDLGTVQSETFSAAYSVNNAGQVVGISAASTETKKTDPYGYPYYKFSEDGFVWDSKAGMKGIGNFTIPVGINASGEISGTTNGLAAVWNGHWITLGTLGGGRYSNGSGINDFGQVVGDAEIPATPTTGQTKHAFIWTPLSRNGVKGTMIDLGALFDTVFDSSSAEAINSKGWVTGTASNFNIADGADHAFVWKPSSANGTTGAVTDLGTLGGDSSAGIAINSGGVVVGSSTLAAGGSRAAIWAPGTDGTYTIADLNNLIPSGTGWTLTKADAINDSGQIVVEAQGHALLLTPMTTTTALARPTASTLTTATGDLAAPTGTPGAASLNLVTANAPPAMLAPVTGCVAATIRSTPIPFTTAPNPVRGLGAAALGSSPQAAPNGSATLDQVFAEFGHHFPDFFDIGLGVVP